GSPLGACRLGYSASALASRASFARGPATHPAMSGLPSACQGQGGKLTHVRAFGKSLRDLHRRLHSGGDGPENLEGLRGVIQKLRSCDSCPRCKEDWSSRGLAGPLDDCWRALQETGSPATQPRRALLEAVEKFYEQTTVNLQVSNEDSSQLWFTQNSVKAVFTHGAHKGQRVSDLVEEIVESGEEQITKFKLIAVFHHGRYKCLCNRRLWAVREASKRLGFPLRVHVDVHPLLSGAKFVDGADGKATDVLLKFEGLHTTTSNGARVRVRPDPPRDSIEAPVDWLLKYQGGRDVDGTPLRTSVLPLLPRLPAIARYIVEGPQRVILMSGSTGCGKSTQVTQAVYDHVRQRDGRGRGPSVVCTQPRRLAACSLDEQVNTDRRFREVWPEEVAGLRITAHQIQGDSTKTGDTRLFSSSVFCTAGVLLQMLKRDGKQGVREFQYIFLDEVHERTIDDVGGPAHEFLVHSEILGGHVCQGDRDVSHPGLGEFTRLLPQSFSGMPALGRRFMCRPRRPTGVFRGPAVANFSGLRGLGAPR
ncbi:unnamed protein product, partial [Prorocentrum cordatum]